jgi:hypothetical protein
MTAVYYQFTLCTIGAAIALAVFLWLTTTDNLPDGEGF